VAAVFAIMIAWWNVGRPRLVFSPEAPVPAGSSVCRKDGSYILYDYSRGFSWYLFGPENRLQYDIAGALGNGSWGYIVGTYDKEASPNNQRLYLNGTRVAQMSDTAAISLNSNPLGIGRHVSGIADPFNGHIDEFPISHVQRSEAGSRPPGTT
jgi:Concanavalin A-like lectin/glucanases superfamily